MADDTALREAQKALEWHYQNPHPSDLTGLRQKEDARCALALDRLASRTGQDTEPVQEMVGALPALTDDEWYDLAQRHATDDWNCDQPDGYLNSIKAVVRDALAASSNRSPAELIDDARDAARYQWLRSMRAVQHWDRLGHYAEGELDARIDSILAATRSPATSTDEKKEQTS